MEYSLYSMEYSLYSFPIFLVFSNKHYGAIIFITKVVQPKLILNLASYSERQKLDFCSESIPHIL